MKTYLTVIFLSIFSLYCQHADGEEYSIKGFLPDGSTIDSGKILSESDSCTFTLIGVGQNIIEKTDGRWSLFLLDKDSTYFEYAFQNGNNRFSLKADTMFFPKFFVFNNLKAVYSEDSVCAYTLAKVCYEASDTESGTIKVELQLRFSLLPEKPSFKYEIVPNNVTEDYGNLILNNIQSEKASEFNCIVKTHVGRRTYTNIYPIPLSQLVHFMQQIYAEADNDVSVIASNHHGYSFEKTISISKGTFSSVETRKEDNIQFYPNPADNIVNISGAERISSLTIIDIAGKTISNINGLDEDKIDVSPLSSGLYIISYKKKNESKIYSVKLIKVSK